MTRASFKAIAAAATILLSCFSNVVYGQGEAPAGLEDLQAYCQNAPCRQNAVVRLRMADGRVQEETSILHRPAITRGSVSILLGEEIRVVPEFNDESFTGWRAPERRESSRNAVLTFKLAQGGDGSISAAITNSGEEPIKLRMDIRPIGASDSEYTSSCPVVAGGTIYAYWEQPVAELIVREALLLSDDMALMCD